MKHTFDKQEVARILDWYGHAVEDSYSRDGGRQMTPGQRPAIRRLRESGEAGCELAPGEIDIVYEWMKRSMEMRFGSAGCLVGPERTPYFRILDLRQGPRTTPTPGVAGQTRPGHPPTACRCTMAGSASANLTAAQTEMLRFLYGSGALLLMAAGVWLLARV